MEASRSTNRRAIAALLLGFLIGIGSILALILGFSAMRQIAEAKGVQRGRGIAIAAIVLGGIGLALFFGIAIGLDQQ
jgi:hypothetical protein